MRNAFFCDFPSMILGSTMSVCLKLKISVTVGPTMLCSSSYIHTRPAMVLSYFVVGGTPHPREWYWSPSIRKSVHYPPKKILKQKQMRVTCDSFSIPPPHQWLGVNLPVQLLKCYSIYYLVLFLTGLLESISTHSLKTITHYFFQTLNFKSLFCKKNKTKYCTVCFCLVIASSKTTSTLIMQKMIIKKKQNKIFWSILQKKLISCAVVI